MDWTPLAPLVLTLGPGLYEVAEEWVGPPFAELQERLSLETGVQLPDLLLEEGPELARTVYQLRLHDEPVLAGELGTLELDRFSQELKRQLETVLRRNLHQFLSLRQVHEQTQAVARHEPLLVRVLLEQFDLAELRRVLLHLVRERVPLRNLARVYELLLECPPGTTLQRVDYLRESLGRTICEPLLRQGRLHVILVEADLEREGELQAALVEALRPWLQKMREQGLPEVVLTGWKTRRPLQQLTRYWMPELYVLSLFEVDSELPVSPLATLELPQARTGHQSK